jgi:hypothetical protein
MRAYAVATLFSAAMAVASPIAEVTTDKPATIQERETLPPCGKAPVVSRSEIRAQPSTVGADEDASGTPFSFMDWDDPGEKWVVPHWKADGRPVRGEHSIDMTSAGHVRLYTTMYRDIYRPYSYALACGVRDNVGKLWTVSRHGFVPSMGDGDPPWPPTVGYERKLATDLTEGWPAVFNGNRTMICVVNVADCIDDTVLKTLSADLESATAKMEDGSTAAGPTVILI